MQARFPLPISFCVFSHCCSGVMSCNQDFLLASFCMLLGGGGCAFFWRIALVGHKHAENTSGTPRPTVSNFQFLQEMLWRMRFDFPPSVRYIRNIRGVIRHAAQHISTSPVGSIPTLCRVPSESQPSLPAAVSLTNFVATQTRGSGTYPTVNSGSPRLLLRCCSVCSVPSPATPFKACANQRLLIRSRLSEHVSVLRRCSAVKPSLLVFWFALFFF